MTLRLPAALLCAAFLAPGAATAAAVMPNILAQADANGDGAVSKAEMDAFLKTEFAQMDTNHDGFVSDDEMKAFILAKMAARAGEMADRRIKADDSNGDGRLTLAELEGDRRLSRMFARLDRDGDGTISRDEMENSRARWMRHHADCGPDMDGDRPGGH
ncbi:MAG: calcium-binding protein [Proteobacteria bacterium]|nr:calcium-binding protein [Pseudomonadota bacterium]MBS0572760.1 calcium-binding protein [Pseudomonadota bacterium]